MRHRIGPWRGPQYGEGIALAIQPHERVQAQQATSAGTGMELDPYLYPPHNSRTLLLTDKIATPGAGEVTSANLSVRLARGEVAAIRQLTLFANSPDDTTAATWRVTVNGVTVPGLAALTMIMRVASSLAFSLDTLRVEVPDGALIQVFITNVDGIPRTFGAQLVGWAMKNRATSQQGAA